MPRGMSVRALLAALALAPLLAAGAGATDPLARAGDCVGVGNTAAEAQDPGLVAWQAETLARHAAADPRSLGNAYPGYGHPEFNDGGRRLNVTFENRRGVTLAGTVFLPDAAPPLVPLVFLEGVKTNKELYQWWHLRMVERGYLVFTFDFTGQGASGGSSDDTSRSAVNDTMDAITWLLDASPVRAALDGARLGTFGHSLGGIAVLEHQERDPRVRAAVAAGAIGAGFVDFERATIPVQIQTADHDGPVAPYPFLGPAMARPLYDELDGPREFVVIESGTHGSHANYPLVPRPTWSFDVADHYAAAWFGHWLRGEAAAVHALTTGHPRLSKLHASEYDLRDGRAGTLDAGGPLPGCVG